MQLQRGRFSKAVGAVVGLALAVGVAPGPAWADAPPARARMEPGQKELLTAHCVKCHNAEDANGGVRLDDLPLEIGTVSTAERWAKVLGVLNSGDMPPEEEPPLPADAKTAFLESLSKQMVVARKALADTGGAITMRRLNRREYVNTIRELLGVEVSPDDLPADDDGSAFDTIGSGLFFSSDQFENYLKLGRAAVTAAITTRDQPVPKIQRLELEESTNKEKRTALEEASAALKKVEEWKKSGKPPADFGLTDEEGARMTEAIFTGQFWRSDTYLKDPATATGVFVSPLPWPVIAEIPHAAGPGKYIVRARLGYPDETMNERKFIEYGLPGKQGFPAELKVLGCKEVTGTLTNPQVVEMTAYFDETTPRSFCIRDRQPNSEAALEMKHWWGKKYLTDKTGDRGFWRGLWVDWVEWEGPIAETWPPKSHTMLLGDVDLHANPGEEQARGIIERLATKAFRGREVRQAYVDALVKQYADRRASGEPFIEAIKTPLSIILASPSFLYIIEPADHAAVTGPPVDLAANPATAPAGPRPRVPLTDIELANRLAYFLWASPPDDALLSAARSGQLQDPAKLAAEVERMLADERVMRFISGFTHQWLHMVRLEFFQFNNRLYEKFDFSGKNAARHEVYETIRTVMKDGLPLGSLLKSDFVVVNDVMADYYGIPGVTGSEFRKVSVPPGVPRGGLMSMAAILAMGSDGERSSPVERGAWVLRKLLHDPPPPAPANVPQLSRFAGTLMPARELMTAHQEQPQCAHCHRKIDPIGYALQHFDGAGNWRDEEYTEYYTFFKVIDKKATFPIDAKGQLPDGTQFDGFEGLRDAVAGHEDDFARGFVEHLVEYALGRPCGFSDEELVAGVLHKSKASHYTPREVIQAIVASPEFHSK